MTRARSRSLSRSCAALAFAASLACAAASASAQAPVTMGPQAAPNPAAPDPAALERDARRAYERREFAVAARGFEAVNRLAPHAALLFNAALAWEQAGDPARAADHYDVALAKGGLDPEQLKQARARLAKLEQSLSTLSVEAQQGAAIRVDGEAAGFAPARVHVKPGDHRVEVDDAEPQRVTVVAAEKRALVFAARAPVAAVTPPPPPQGTSPLRIGGWVTLGVAGVAAGAAIGLGVAAISARDDFVHGSGSTSVTLHDRAVALRTATNVTWALAGAAAITGVALHIAAPRGTAKGAALVVGPGLAAARFAF
jgi:hypothetical protein